jgi:tRNA(Ile)-lysidine synthase
MLKLLFPLPKTLIVALSGGVDSVAVADFLSRKHDVSCAFFHHATENSSRAFRFVSDFCTKRDLPLFVGYLTTDKPKDTSPEEHWRNERYKFLESFDATVITAHNLDDCVETYLYGSLHGQPKVIPHKRNNVVRPFLTTPKYEFVKWCERKNISWCEDTSNQDVKYMRNYIRHEIVPRAFQVNPGLDTVVRKIVESKLPL